jgi:subtilisin family serine protease
LAVAAVAMAVPAVAQQAPVYGKGARKIPGKYIVVLKQGSGAPAAVAATHGAVPEHVYDRAIKGFAGPLSAPALQQLRNDPAVAYIEEDGIITTVQSRGGDVGANAKPPWAGGPGGDDGTGDPEPDPVTTESIPWGITRVNGGTIYTGSNVAWVIDTGIDLNHEDLNVDASRGYNAFLSGKDAKNLDDGNGHGTHVAGTIAAVKGNGVGVVGVAAGATVIPVKVLNSRGSGSYSGVIAGVNHVAANGINGDVANMSLGGPVSQALDDAVSAAAHNGIKFCLAAGNESQDANNSSPARVNGNNIYTISAFGTGDNFASFSNYGNPPVDYSAPGVAIESTWKDGGYNTISGTSMASPHVAGILLLGSIGNGGTVSGDPDGDADVIATN